MTTTKPSTLRIGVLGLGEAGSRFASGLAATAGEVRGFDPADVPTPDGVVLTGTPAKAVTGAEVVIALTHAAQAADAAGSAVPHMSPGTYYADFSTSDPGLKRDLAGLARRHGLRFIDGAIMNPVPLAGVATPVDVSGDDAADFAALLNPLGLRLEAIGPEPGLAATRKLLRSILVKGLSALIIESARAAETAGVADWYRQHMFEVLCGIEPEFVVRLVRGNLQHSQRRIHEMAAASTLLRQFGEPPLTAEATRQVLESVAERGVPDVTAGPPAAGPPPG
jgi:3-hydroxyisobutyrate dehydrogenase-like beta-hydroxyacid dehydrogenase